VNQKLPPHLQKMNDELARRVESLKRHHKMVDDLATKFHQELHAWEISQQSGEAAEPERTKPRYTYWEFICLAVVAAVAAHMGWHVLTWEFWAWSVPTLVATYKLDPWGN
jgi:type VI protein secretion system component VasF